MSIKSNSEKRPWVSNSLGVHPRQVKDANEAARKQGSRHHYNEKGQAVAHSQAARNDAMKMQNSVDYEGGYGDHTGR
jgi:hypothetical protein